MKAHTLILIAAVGAQASPILLPHNGGRPTYAITRRGFFDDIGSAIGGLFGGGGGGSSSSGSGGLGGLGSILGSVFDKDKSTGEKIGDIAGAVLGNSKEGSTAKKVGDVLSSVLDKDKSTEQKIGDVVGAVLGDAEEGSTAKKIGDVVGAVLNKDSSTGDKIGEVAGAIFGDGSKADKVADAVGAVVDKNDDGDAGTKIGEAIGAVIGDDKGVAGKIGGIVDKVLGGGNAGAAAAGAAVAAPPAAAAGAAAAAADAAPAADDSAAAATPAATAAVETAAPAPAPAPSPAPAPAPAAPSPAAEQPQANADSCSPNAPTLNAATVNLIKDFEGFVASPEPDPIGLPTVGFGHLCQQRNCAEVPFSFPLSQDTAASLLQTDAQKFTSCLSRLISKDVTLNDNQFGALTSWAFNIGCGAVGRSTLVRRLNRGEAVNTVISQELPRFNRAGGRVLRGLTRRRNAEVALANTASNTVAHPTC